MDYLCELGGSTGWLDRIVNVKCANAMASGQGVSLAKSDLAVARVQLVGFEGSQKDAVREVESNLALGAVGSPECVTRIGY